MCTFPEWTAQDLTFLPLENTHSSPSAKIGASRPLLRHVCWRLFATHFYLGLFALRLTKGYVSLRCVLIELSSAEFALNAIVSLLFHLLHSCSGLWIHNHRTASIITFACTDSLSELHRLEFPFRNFTFSLLLSCFGLFLCLNPCALTIWIVIKTLARGIWRFSLLRCIKCLSLIDKDFLTNLAMFNNCFLREFSTTIVTFDESADFTVFIRLFLVLLRSQVRIFMLYWRLRWLLHHRRLLLVPSLLLLHLLLLLLIVLLWLGWGLPARLVWFVWDLLGLLLLSWTIANFIWASKWVASVFKVVGWAATTRWHWRSINDLVHIKTSIAAIWKVTTALHLLLSYLSIWGFFALRLIFLGLLASEWILSSDWPCIVIWVTLRLEDFPVVAIHTRVVSVLWFGIKHLLLACSWWFRHMLEVWRLWIQILTAVACALRCTCVACVLIQCWMVSTSPESLITTRHPFFQ